MYIYFSEKEFIPLYPHVQPLGRSTKKQWSWEKEKISEGVLFPLDSYSLFAHGEKIIRSLFDSLGSLMLWNIYIHNKYVDGVFAIYYG